MSDPIYIILTWIAASMLFGIAVVLFLKWRNRKQESDYPANWEKYRIAVDSLDIIEVIKYGENVIWNDYLELDHRRQMFSEIGNLVKTYPELKGLWNDVHYKNTGREPLD